MAHEIQEDAHAAYNVQAGRAWHNLGIGFAGDGTIEEQIQAALAAAPLLGSEHRLIELSVVSAKPWAKNLGPEYTLQAQTGAELPIRIAAHPKAAAVVRLEDGHVLPGAVGKDSFGIYQPQQMAADAAAVAMKLPGARLSFAAYLYGGSKVFWCFDLGDLSINGEQHNRHLTVMTGLDGCAKREIMLHITRAVCANTVAVAKAQSRRGTEENGMAYLGVKNTRHADERTQVAFGDIEALLEHCGALKRKLEVLPAVRVDEAMAKEAVETSLERAGYSTESKVYESKVEEILADYDDPKADHASWHGTLNGVYQALTNERSNRATVRGGRVGGENLEGSEAREKLLQHRYDGGAKATETYLAVMEEIARKRGFGVELDAAGVHVGYVLGDDSGDVAAKVV